MAISGWGVFLIILVLVVIFGAGGYVLYAHYRARKLGLPPPNFNPFSKKRGEPSNYRAPTPAPGGILGWFSDKWNTLTSGRTAGGAYEGTSYNGASGGYGGGQQRGLSSMDADEAWDARVDGYHEEQDLGLHDPSQGPYGGGGYSGGLDDGRGRSRSRDGRYDEAGSSRTNPFGDNADASSMSLRDVSPRPDAKRDKARTPSHTRGQASLNTMGSADDSPTERRSMFREDV